MTHRDRKPVWTEPRRRTRTTLRALRPTVSILIPAYHAEATIARAVGSVLAQDFEDWEIVVASDDGTDYLAVLVKAGIDDPRIRQVATGRHGVGCANARNAALDAAGGSLVTPLDADDVFMPDRLSALVPIAERNGAVVDNIAAVEEGSLRVLSHFLPTRGSPDLLDTVQFFRTWVPAKPLVSARLGLRWDPDTGLSDDIVYVAQLIDRLGPLTFVARALQEYRVGRGSLCHCDASVANAEAGYCRLLDRLDDGSLALNNPAIRESVCRGVHRKRQLNRQFGEAQARGFDGTFQHFAAVRAGQPLPPSRIRAAGPGARARDSCRSLPEEASKTTGSIACRSTPAPFRV